MTYYYETAPLPTALAWLMHHAPVWWHHFESWATLAFELGVPFGIFVGARPVRYACAAILTGFQLINAATANYGFFCYLAAALHVFLLDDGDVERVLAWLRHRFALAPPSIVDARMKPWQRVGAGVVIAIFVAVSACDAAVSFLSSDALFAALMPIRRVYEPFRLINTYHLFGSITRTRIEADFQTSDDGENWISHDFRHKPGDPRRRPDWVAPHQPRVDFQLWFYGLSYRAGTPEYVATLIERLCRDPLAVQPLFRTPPDLHPKAARIVFWQYHFTTSDERKQSGAWWTRQAVDVTDAVPCDTKFPSPDALDDE